MPVKILIADDYAAFREFLKSFVAKMLEMCIAGEAADGEEAVQLVGHLKPDLVLMDVEMPRMDGLEATRRIKALSTPTTVVLFSALADEAHTKGAAESGADGFLAKGTSVRQMITAVRNLAVHGSGGFGELSFTDESLNWRKLCRAAVVEQNPDKLSQIVQRINAALELRQRVLRLHSRLANQQCISNLDGLPGTKP